MLSPEDLAQQLAKIDLSTERLGLRPITPDDDEVQIEHEANRAIMDTIRDPLPLDEIEKRVRAFAAPWQAEEGSWVGLSLVETATGKVTGFFFLRVESHENQIVELGYRLHPDYWGLGYATEAARSLLAYLDDVLKVRKVVAYCVAYNDASAGLLEKLGFNREGCLSKHSPLGGLWQDELVYGLVLAPDREVP